MTSVNSTIRVLMKAPAQGSQDGHTVEHFQKGDTPLLTPRLADVFVNQMDVAEYVEEKDAGEAPENKAMDATPENKAVPTTKKKKSRRTR